MNVTIYTTPTCGYCRQAKRFLDERGIRYSEKDVSVDRNAADEMVARSGQMGVPVIDVDGEVIVGFDRPRLEQLLSRAGPQKPPSFGVRVADASKMGGKAGAAASGAYVGQVHPGSPADRAGLQVGDVITAISDRAVRNADDLSQALAGLGNGSQVSITVMRGGNSYRVEARI